jgi:hypothetical protein
MAIIVITTLERSLRQREKQTKPFQKMDGKTDRTSRRKPTEREVQQ